MLWAGLWKYSELDWCNLNELLGNRVIGWIFSVQGPPSTFRMGSKLAAKKFLLQFQVLLLHLRRAKILLQRTRELTLFTGLIPAQAIKFLTTPAVPTGTVLFAASCPELSQSISASSWEAAAAHPQRWWPNSSGWSPAHVQDFAVTVLKATKS